MPPVICKRIRGDSVREPTEDEHGSCRKLQIDVYGEEPALLGSIDRGQCVSESKAETKTSFEWVSDLVREANNRDVLE